MSRGKLIANLALKQFKETLIDDTQQPENIGSGTSEGTTQHIMSSTEADFDEAVSIFLTQRIPILQKKQLTNRIWNLN